MDILDRLIKLMLEKVEVKPVPKQELDEFLTSQKLQICDEHYQFLLNYGNSDFLINWFANLTFGAFKDYYLDDEFFEGSKLPEGYNYVGMDFNDELLCKSNDDRRIYIFGYGRKDLLYYGGIKELLFFSLFKLLYKNNFFDKVKENIKINDIDRFKEKYLAYEIKGIYRYDRYFLKDNELIICDNNFHSYHLYRGGILNKITPAP
mgnify:CR=1 FL=1